MEPESGLQNRAVFDTSPLIFLDLLGYLPALPRLHRTVVPEAVLQELSKHPEGPGSSVADQRWIDRRSPKPESLRSVEDHAPLSLGSGEMEAIALALELSCLVVLDDRLARNYAHHAGLKVTGTLGILLKIHALGLVIRSLNSDIDALEQGGMYLSATIRKAALDFAEKSPET